LAYSAVWRDSVSQEPKGKRDTSFFDVAVAVGIAFVMGVNLALGVAILRRSDAPREALRKLEIIVKSVYMGAVMQEERMVVDATSDEPVELTLVLDEQAKEYL